MEFPYLSGFLFVTNMLFLVMNTADHVEKVEFDVCKQGKDDVTFTKTSLYQCIQNCRVRKDCESLSFHRMSLFCRLHRGNSTYHVCKDQGMVYLAKNTGSFEETAECPKCKRYQTCTFNNATSGYRCVYTECKPLEGKSLGNKQTVGSQVRRDCEPGYYSVHGISYRICQDNGEWSGTEPMCCPEGWLYFGNACYKFESGTKLTFEDALVNCQQLHEGSNLLFIGSESEDSYIKDTLERLENVVTIPKWRFFWIRMTRVGDMWKLAGENTTVSWFNWLPTEPNHFYGENSENCGSVIFSPRLLVWGWNDIACDKTLTPICKLKSN